MDGVGAHLGHVGAAGVENIEDLRRERVGNVTVSIALQSSSPRFVRRVSPRLKSPENTRILRELRAARVACRESGTHELATAKQTVSHELARAEGTRGVRHLGDDPVGGHCASERGRPSAASRAFVGPCFSRSRSPLFFSVSDRIDELSRVIILTFPPYNPVKQRSVAIWPW